MIKIATSHEYYTDHVARMLGAHCSVAQGLASPITAMQQRTQSQVEAVRHLFFYIVRFGPENHDKIVKNLLKQPSKKLNLLVAPTTFEKAMTLYGLLCEDLRLMLSSQPIQHNFQMKGGGRRIPMLWKPAIIFPMLFPKDYYGNQWYADWVTYKMATAGRDMKDQVNQIVGVYLNEDFSLDIDSFIGSGKHGARVHDYMKTGYQHLTPSPGELCQECIFGRSECERVTKSRPPIKVILHGMERDGAQRAIEIT